MLLSKQHQKKASLANIPTSLDSTNGFHRINIEYFSIYKALDTQALLGAIQQRIGKTLTRQSIDRDRAIQWREHYKKALDKLAVKITTEQLRQQKKLPMLGLQQLSDNPSVLQTLLQKNPNDYLCHFQLAWLYSVAKNLALAERHFNIAALHSQSTNPQFACFAFRHLANTRYQAGKYEQALLAIETARQCNQLTSAELQFEYVRMLAKAQRTTHALQQLATLIQKAPHYEVIAEYEADLQSNPSFKRFFVKRHQLHQKNVQHNLQLHWENDPLRLLDLDKELGQKNSFENLQRKQSHTLAHLPSLLLSDELNSSQLIQQQSRRFIMSTLDVRKQHYIQEIEQHQTHTQKIHTTGQWFIYAAVIALMSLALSYGVSTLASLLAYHWPVNLTIQSYVLIGAGILGLVGMILLYFTPKKLSRLMKQKQQLEQLSSKLGVSE